MHFFKDFAPQILFGVVSDAYFIALKRLQDYLIMRSAYSATTDHFAAIDEVSVQAHWCAIHAEDGTMGTIAVHHGKHTLYLAVEHLPPAKFSNAHFERMHREFQHFKTNIHQFVPSIVKAV